MNEDFSLDDARLEDVHGGAAAPDFSRIADSFAWANRCADCPHQNIYSNRRICTEVYNELLANYSMNRPIGERCSRRG